MSYKRLTGLGHLGGLREIRGIEVASKIFMSENDDA